ncbi:hypothetical protein TIFTF001_017559 [Ficus carica]|uniref:Uncharacterized protein n=1 Tax=Ficus carica TaxID=3494 RepID=A0AA88AUI4_FICCA|nr:hypothetical protein TIFTF001_017559 [Ficus carica]
MNLSRGCSSRGFWVSSISPIITNTTTTSTLSPTKFSFPFFRYPFRHSVVEKSRLARAHAHARKRPSNSDQPNPIISPIILQQVSDDDDDNDDLLFDELEDDDGLIICCGSFLPLWKVGDGGAGGGISLAGTWWDKKALEIAEEVSLSFDGDLNIYAFKTLSNSTIRVRIENLTKKLAVIKQLQVPISLLRLLKVVFICVNNWNSHGMNGALNSLMFSTIVAVLMVAHDSS